LSSDKNMEPPNCPSSMNTTETMNYYKVTEIEFDFDGEDLTQEEQDEIINESKSCLWDSPNEKDLADVITNNLGWSVKSLKYDIVQ
jgi:hypothetical protein